MPTTLRAALVDRWTTTVPIAALVVLAFTWSATLGTVAVIVVGALLAGAVLSAVHHAEVVAHRVGEPFGSLVLAVSVTVIEVALIVTLMVSGGESASSLARDTVFAALMITINGIIGFSLLAATLRTGVTAFNAEGSGAALATVGTLAALTLVVPVFTTGSTGPVFTPAQLAFAAVSSLVLYGSFVFVQTVRHRDYFLPAPLPLGTVDGGRPDDVAEDEDPPRAAARVDDELHADPPTNREALTSLVMLIASLVAVVGLAKVESPAIEDAIEAIGAPQTAVGVVIALLVLSPEGLAAVKAARQGRTQVSFNLGMGSAMASIGLTIPTIAVATIWLEGPLQLGLDPVQLVLLAATLIAATLTVVPGRATLQQAVVHLVLFAAFLFLAVSP